MATLNVPQPALAAEFSSAAPGAVPGLIEPRPWLTVAANLDPRFGGVSAMMAPLVRSVSAAAGIPAALAAFCETGEDVSAIAGQVTRHERYALRGLKAWLPGPEQARLESQVRAAAGVHIHGLWQEHCGLAARAARRFRTPYIISAHGMLDPWALESKRWKKDLYMSLVEKRNLAGAACLHALTHSEAESYRKLAPGVPVAVIPNGADVPKPVSPDLFLSRFPHLRNRRLVLFLARLHAKKGLDILLEAWRAVGARQPDAHLVLAGPDSNHARAGFEALTQRLGLSDRVTFTGMLAGREKWSAFAAAGLFVLPSYSEGLSVSVLEAMGSGLPVLVTEQCHVDGIVESACGWQIQPRAGEVESALDGYFALTPAVTRAMGLRGQDLVNRCYAWRGIGRRMASLYEWVNGGPQPADLTLV